MLLLLLLLFFVVVVAVAVGVVVVVAVGVVVDAAHSDRGGKGYAHCEEQKKQTIVKKHRGKRSRRDRHAEK